MAREKGYIKSTSFFRTHPPYIERISSTFSEIEYLPPSDEMTVDSKAFRKAKEQLEKFIERFKEEKKSKPTLKRWPECDDEDENPRPEESSRTSRSLLGHQKRRR